MAVALAGGRRRRNHERRSFFDSFTTGARRCVIAITVAIAAPAAALAFALLAATTILHHRRRALFKRLDPYREIADHVLVDAHSALELVHRYRRRVEIEEHVMPFAVLLHAIGEVAEAPILPLGHLAALLGDHGGKGIGQGLDLRRRDILARNEHVLVKRHGRL